MSRHYFVIKIYKKSQYFNFLFELPNGMSLIGYHLLPISSLVVTLEKILFLLKKFIANLIKNLFKAWFSKWKKKLLIVISCRCPDYATYTDLFTLSSSNGTFLHAV